MYHVITRGLQLRFVHLATDGAYIYEHILKSTNIFLNLRIYPLMTNLFV